MLLIFSSSTLLAPFCASKIQIAKTQKPSFLIPHHTCYPVIEGELMHNSPLEKAPAHKKPKAYNSWSPTLEAEVLKLLWHNNTKEFVSERSCQQMGLLRCGKSCKLRWINYLRADFKRGNITAEEEETIVKLHIR